MSSRSLLDATSASLLVLCAVLGCANIPRSDSAGETSDLIAYLGNEGGFWQVWTVSPQGRGARQITSSEYEKVRVSWYPDGQRLLVHDVSGRLVTVDLGSGRETVIPDLVFDGQDAVLSPQGETIAASDSLTPTPDTNEIVLFDLATGSRKILPSVAATQFQPVWSPDGNWIYFLVPTDSRLENNIWRSNRTGSQIEQLTAGHAYHLDVAPAKSGEVVFSSNRSGDYELWSWDVDRRGDPVRLTESEGFDGEATWVESSGAIVFSSTRSGTRNLWRIDTGDRTAVKITNHSGGARAPAAWSARDDSR